MIAAIWASFRRLPLWVQIWVALILVPVNMVSLAFAGAPGGALVAALAVGGMVPNLAILARERGFSRAMAFPHVVIWTPLIAVIVWRLAAGAEGTFAAYLWLLLAVDLVSLGFDYTDAWRWWRGEREVA
ncbi:MAG: hypothetical protein D6754_02310 [Alphaproteobacteria bacterium]|nr:MAG: hypothetical protein D6754_02310 [Alphaproteobacteria bacterium]